MRLVKISVVDVQALNLFFVGDLEEKPPVFLIMRQLLPGDGVVAVNRQSNSVEA